MAEIGFGAISRGAPKDAAMTEYPANTTFPWHKSWVEREKDRRKRFPSSTSDPTIFYANMTSITLKISFIWDVLISVACAKTSAYTFIMFDDEIFHRVRHHTRTTATVGQTAGGRPAGRRNP